MAGNIFDFAEIKVLPAMGAGDPGGGAFVEHGFCGRGLFRDYRHYRRRNRFYCRRRRLYWNVETEIANTACNFFSLKFFAEFIFSAAVRTLKDTHDNNISNK